MARGGGLDSQRSRGLGTRFESAGSRARGLDGSNRVGSGTGGRDVRRSFGFMIDGRNLMVALLCKKFHDSTLADKVHIGCRKGDNSAIQSRRASRKASRTP